MAIHHRYVLKDYKGLLPIGCLLGFGADVFWVTDFSSRIESPTVSYQGSCFTDSIADIDRDGNQDFLRFPAFHPDILDQRHWDAGDPYGRIKVVIAEGFARPNRSPPFERVKDVISMSFQHAPLSKSRVGCLQRDFELTQQQHRYPGVFQHCLA